MTEDLNTVLAGESGVYRLAGLSGADVLAEVRRMGWRTAHLNAADVGDKASFLHAAQRALDLPGYFGHNWDAFDECLRDLPAADGYMIFIEQPAHFARSRPQEWAVALSVLHDAVEFYRERGTPFYVLLGRTRGAAPHVPILG